MFEEKIKDVQRHLFVTIRGTEKNFLSFLPAIL